MRQKQTAPQAVQSVLDRLEKRARQADDNWAGILDIPLLPMDALAEAGTLARMDSPNGLPSLLVESSSGQCQIEISPFGPLALISSDGDMDTDAVTQALQDAGITPLFPGDIDAAGEWHGHPLSRWLFPRQLSDALTLMGTL